MIEAMTKVQILAKRFLMSKLLYLTGSKWSKTLPAIVADIFGKDIVTYVERCQSVVVELREFRIMGIEE